MAPKKKPVRNAFFFFMQDVKRDEEGKGRVFRGGMREVSEFCSKMWTEMSADEKEPYVKMAAEAKLQRHEDLTKKFTSLGVSYAALEAEEREREHANQVMNDTVQRIVRALPRDGEFKHQEFFVCHVNYFYANDKGVFFPAEIGVAAFSLQQGLVRSLHSFVDPGPVHLGYRYEATDWALSTHQIPFDEPTWTRGEKDYRRLFYRIKSLIQFNDKKTIPPIFTMPDSLNNNTSISAVKSFFRTMCEAAGEDVTAFRIYPLPLLLFELRNHCFPEDTDALGASSSQQIKLPTVAMAELQLQRDVFTYAKNIACEFHEENDRSTYCSLSVVIRWVFTLCDYCCMLLGIQLVPNKHCPIDADVSASAGATTGWEVRPSKKSSSPSSEMDNDSSTARNKCFMPTIIDHGKLREKMEAEYGPSTSGYEPPADIRLPKVTSYSAAIKSNTARAAPELNKMDFPIVSSQRRGGGRGRGASQPTPEVQPPYWPVSGRGARLNRQS